MPENAGPCDVEIVKYGKLQEDLTVRVRAFTIDQYEDMTGNIFDVNVNPAEGKLL